MNNRKLKNCSPILNSVFNSETFAVSFFGLFIFTWPIVQGNAPGL